MKSLGARSLTRELRGHADDRDRFDGDVRGRPVVADSRDPGDALETREAGCRRRREPEADRSGAAGKLDGPGAGHKAPVVQNRDAVAKPLGFVHVVGDENHRGAVVTGLLDQLPGIASRGRIESLRELIEEQRPAVG